MYLSMCLCICMVRINYCTKCRTTTRREGSIDPFRALFHFRQLRGNWTWTRSKMLFVPEDGAGSGIVRYSGFPRSHAHVAYDVYMRVCMCIYIYIICTCMCMYVVCVRVPCAATYRIASTTHFATGVNKSRSRDSPCRLNNQSRDAR